MLTILYVSINIGNILEKLERQTLLQFFKCINNTIKSNLRLTFFVVETFNTKRKNVVVKRHNETVTETSHLTLKSQMHVTMFPILRHSPSNLHVLVSHKNRSVSRSSEPGGPKPTRDNSD